MQRSHCLLWQNLLVNAQRWIRISLCLDWAKAIPCLLECNSHRRFLNRWVPLLGMNRWNPRTKRSHELVHIKFWEWGSPSLLSLPPLSQVFPSSCSQGLASFCSTRIGTLYFCLCRYLPNKRRWLPTLIAWGRSLPNLPVLEQAMLPPLA